MEDGERVSVEIFGRRVAVDKGPSTGVIVTTVLVILSGVSMAVYAGLWVWFMDHNSPSQRGGFYVLIGLYSGLASLLLSSGVLLTRGKRWAWWVAFAAVVATIALTAQKATSVFECLAMGPPPPVASVGSSFCVPGFGYEVPIAALSLASASLACLAGVFQQFHWRHWRRSSVL